MNDMIDPNTVTLPKFRKGEIDQALLRQLEKQDPKDWTPIVLDGNRVSDGYQRVLIARHLGIPLIPFRRIA